jgi:hypothetical protein
MTDIITLLRTRNGNATGFGLGPVCDKAADALDAARVVGIRQEQIIMDQEREIERLRTELANVNNEFGSQTADWPNAWERVAEIKRLAGKRWVEIESLRADAARWQWLVRHASLGFDAAPSWNAVVRLPVFSHDDQTITALVDAAMKP